MGAERHGDHGAWGTAPYSGNLVASPTFFGHAHLAAYDKVGENRFLQKPNIRFQEDRLPLTPKHKTLGLEVGPARQWPTPYTHRQDCDVNTDIYLGPPVSGSVCTRKACTWSVCWIFSVLSLWASGWLWVPCLIWWSSPFGGMMSPWFHHHHCTSLLLFRVWTLTVMSTWGHRALGLGITWSVFLILETSGFPMAGWLPPRLLPVSCNPTLRIYRAPAWPSGDSSMNL